MEKEKLKSWEEHGHHTFWWHVKKIYNIDRPNKYCVIFNTYKDGPESFSITAFDTLDEALEEAKLINIMYHDTPKPQKIYDENGRYWSSDKWYSKKYNLDFSNGAYFWGYALLDMINNKIVKTVNEVNRFGYTIDNKPSLTLIDVLFRGEDEIPEDYIWDSRGEYEGWLQFRWGDGKNAIGYVEELKTKRPGYDDWIDIYDNVLDQTIRKKVRVVDVPWDAPLPKKEPGIYYRRPNKEPVIFPGEIGYDGDYSMNPWALSEEIATEEYCKNNDGQFDNNKVGKTTMMNILGDDNPLLKLKKELELNEKH